MALIKDILLLIIPIILAQGDIVFQNIWFKEYQIIAWNLIKVWLIAIWQ